MQWHSQSSKSMQPLDLEFVALLNTEPLFQPQHLQTELHKGSKHFLFADHFYQFLWPFLLTLYIDIGRRKLILVILWPWPRLNCCCSLRFSRYLQGCLACRRQCALNIPNFNYNYNYIKLINYNYIKLIKAYSSFLVVL